MAANGVAGGLQPTAAHSRAIPPTAANPFITLLLNGIVLTFMGQLLVAIGNQTSVSESDLRYDGTKTLSCSPVYYEHIFCKKGPEPDGFAGSTCSGSGFPEQHISPARGVLYKRFGGCIEKNYVFSTKTKVYRLFSRLPEII
jgi:hypothetical protein